MKDLQRSGEDSIGGAAQSEAIGLLSRQKAYSGKRS